MNNLNPRIARLKQMMALEEKRAELENELDSLVQQLSALNDQLLDEGAPSPAPAASPAPPVGSRRRGRPPGVKNKRNPRGLLKDKIMAALESAGAAGVKVKELAASIGTKPVNVHSWFHSALKRKEPIKKVTGGHYRLTGHAAPAEPKFLKPAKAAAPAALGKTRRGGAKRGQLSAQILAALKDAGSGGITVADLAEKLGAKYKNIYIWFATTGKKQPNVKKLAPAKYKLAA